MTLSVGSDPEFFLRDSKGELITAIGLLGGTKRNPRKTKHGWLQEDGVAAEFNSIPSKTLQSFIENHRLVMEDLNNIISPMGISLDMSASLEFDKDLLLSHQATTSGCDPDFNAWERQENESPDLYDTSIRATGGHLHIAFDGVDDLESRLSFVKVLDMELGVPSVLLDNDKLRRKMYGQAGAFRPKIESRDGFNGIEYRVLSNFWLKNEDYMKFIWEKIQFCNDNWKELIAKAESLKEEIVYNINSCDYYTSKLFCEKQGVVSYV